MKESRIVFIIGKRHTGKSVLVKDLLSKIPRPDYAIAMAPTEDSLAEFRKFLPESCIFDHFSQDKLERAVSVQRELVSRGKKRTLLILLDDCMYQKGVLRSSAMRSIFFNGRHDHISLWVTAQYMMDVEVSLRTNIDYLFTMRENILTNRHKLHKYYFGFFKFDVFDKVMSACTQDYKALVLDGTVPSNEATDVVHWYKASQDIPQFTLCKPIFWKLSAKYSVSQSELRANKEKQFEIEQAAASEPNMPKTRQTVVVQTEDENGNVATTFPARA